MRGFKVEIRWCRMMIRMGDVSAERDSMCGWIEMQELMSEKGLVAVLELLVS